MTLSYIPNILSFFRLLCGPLIFLLFLENIIFYKWIALLIFFIGSVSDALDGYLARTYNWVTDFGKNIDPFADKIFIISVLLLLFYTVPHFFPLWMLIVVVLRDLMVTFIRISSKKNKISFNTSSFAKIKTIIQSIGLHLCLLIIILNSYFPVNLKIIYYVMFFSTSITFLTGLDYLKIYLQQINEK